MHVCFICTANASRSPMAEALFRDYLEKNNRYDITVSSAGVSDHALHGVSDIVEAAMCRKMGIDIHNRKRVHISEIDTAAPDLYAVMEEYHADELKKLGISNGKIYFLGGGIADPHRNTLTDHRRCRDEILSSLPDLLDFIDNL